jgi:hypothetical protein
MHDGEPYGIDDEYISTSDLNEIIYYEKLDADMEMAQFEAEGNRYWRLVQKSQELLAEGKIEEAVEMCPHGGGCWLSGSCAEGDPRHGEEGLRCNDCGAVVDDLHGKVIYVR